MADDDRETQLAERERKVAEGEARIAAAQAEEKEKEAAEFAEGLVASGQLLPRQKARVVSLLLNLPTDTPLEFAEGEQTISEPADKLLRGLLSDLPKQVDFAEKSGGGDIVDAFWFEDAWRPGAGVGSRAKHQHNWASSVRVG